MEINLEDITSICRICLQCRQSNVVQEIGELSSIHSTITINSENISIMDVITTCLSNKLSDDKTFPQMVCNHCVCRLTDSYQLKFQIQQSEQFLFNVLSHRLSMGRNVEYLDDKELLMNTLDLNSIETNLDDFQQSQTGCEIKGDNILPVIKVENSQNDSNARTNSECHPTEQHLISNSSKSCFKCLICSKRFSASLTLNRHLITHHSVRNDINVHKPHQCDECPKSYTTMANLVLHKAIHTGIKSFTCEICQRGFYKKTSLVTHMSIHTGIRKYLCTICGRSFTSANILQQHKRTHSDVRRYSCSVCLKGFHTSNDLRVHFRSHSGEKPYLCSNCGRSFSRVTHLNIHLRTHSGEKPYMCQQCPKAFAQSGDLKAHIRIHSGEKPYFCRICDKRFNQTSGLASHMKSHTGERNYICFCGKSFTQSSSLARHGKLHRKNEPGAETT